MVRVLAIDPSTVASGVALVDYPDNGGAGSIVHLSALCTPRKGSDSFTARARRIHTQAGMFLDAVAWRIRQDLTPDDTILIVVEKGFHKGPDSDALPMTVGAFLSHVSSSVLAQAEFQDITRQAACTTAGCLAIYRAPKGRTNREQEEKRERLKLAVIRWASDHFGINLQPNEDAVADALALAQAAYDAHRLKQIAASQQAMKLRKTPTSPTRKKIA